MCYIKSPVVAAKRPSDSIISNIRLERVDSVTNMLNSYGIDSVKGKTPDTPIPWRAAQRIVAMDFWLTKLKIAQAIAEMNPSSVNLFSLVLTFKSMHPEASRANV